MIKKVKLLFVYFCFTLIYYPLFSQITNEKEAMVVEKKIHSLSYQEQTQSYQNLISYYSKVSLEKAHKLSNEFVELCKKNNDLRMQAEALNFLGRTKIRMGNLEEAKAVHVEALFLFQALGNDTGMAAQYGNLGVIFEISGDFPKALIFYQKALKIYQNIGDIKSIAFVENNIGIVYQELSLFEPALSYHKKAFQHKQEQNDSSGMASSLNNIGVLYESLKNNYPQALFYYHESFDIYDKLNNQLQKATLLNNIGLIYLKQEKLDSAASFLLSSLAIRTNMNDKQGIASTLLNLAQMELKRHNAERARELSLKSILLFKEIGSKIKLYEAYQTHADASEMSNNYYEALQSVKKSSQYRDSVLNESNQKAFHEMQAKYELDISQKQLTILEKENALKDQSINRNLWVLIAIVTFFVLTISTILFFVRQHRLKIIHRQLLVEQKLFRAQMNPHFIFNALSSIQAFIQNNDKDLGSKYITQFARLMRRILDYSTREFIPLSDELEVLNDYVEFQRLRFSNSFRFQLVIDENIETELINVPPMLLQPFVENAIEHGVRNIENAWIKIELKIQDNHLMALITDNGIGIEKSKLLKQNDNHHSMALQITRERLILLSKSNKNNPEINISDCSHYNPSISGTEVRFEIPVISH